MGISAPKGNPSPPAADWSEKRRHHRKLMRRTLLHLLSIYFLPLLLLTVYFHLQSLNLRQEGHQRHLQSIAEYQARMLDLFIRERAVNLSNLIDNPALEPLPSHATMQSYLEDLKRDSETFVDLGVFNAQGRPGRLRRPLPGARGAQLPSNSGSMTFSPGSGISSSRTSISASGSDRISPSPWAVSSTAGSWRCAPPSIRTGCMASSLR